LLGLSIGAASLGLPANAQTVVLANIDSSFRIGGRLVDYQNHVFTLVTQYGRLSIKDHNLICTGSACPSQDQRPSSSPPEIENEHLMRLR